MSFVRALHVYGYAAGVVRVRTGAGIKPLRLLNRSGLSFEFEMNMGTPRVVADYSGITGKG